MQTTSLVLVITLSTIILKATLADAKEKEYRRVLSAHVGMAMPRRRLMRDQCPNFQKGGEQWNVVPLPGCNLASSGADPGITIYGNETMRIRGDCSSRCGNESYWPVIDMQNGGRHFLVKSKGTLLLARLTLKGGKGNKGGSLFIEEVQLFYSSLYCSWKTMAFRVRSCIHREQQLFSAARRQQTVEMLSKYCISLTGRHIFSGWC